MVPDLLGDNWIWYELDEIINGVDGWVNAFKPLNFLADGQRIVGERRVAMVVRWTAVHFSGHVAHITLIGTKKGRTSGRISRQRNALRALRLEVQKYRQAETE